MKNSKKLFTFLDEMKNQLYVPVFQRDYSWEDDHYKRLWEDIIEMDPNNDLDTHFINTIIHKPQPNNKVSKVGYDLLVDGQQRVTSCMLLFAAICSYCKRHPEANVTFNWEKEIYHTVLINQNGDEKTKYKLRLKEGDDYFLKNILEKLPAGNQLKDENCRYHNNNNNRLLRAYNAYYLMLNEDNVDLIFNNMLKLEMYDGEAEEHDDPQELFDSLNTTGAELRPFEQIRNYLLMSFEEKEQITLYNGYWKEMEEYFTSKETFNKFMHSYIRYLRPYLFSSTSIKKMYISLKRELKKGNLTKKEVIKDIHRCFLIYKSIKGIDITSPNYLLLNGILANSSVSSWAIIFKLYTVHSQGIIGDEELKYCLELYLSHLLRYIISYHGTALAQKFDMGLIDLSDFCKSFKKALFKAHPGISDNMFKEHILSTNFYTNSKIRPMTKNIFERIEMSFYSKGSMDFKKYSIEHIMPQTIVGTEWVDQLGKNAKEIHETYVNDIGNLTLTAYNTEYSNETFEEKLEMKNGFKDDRLHLNKSIIKYNHWNEDTIQQRNEYLAQKICEVYSYPTLPSKKDSKANQSMLMGGK